MDIMTAIRSRHSVREYTEQAIEDDVRTALEAEIAECAQAGNIDIQLVENNPEVFQVVAKFGLIHGASTSIAFVAREREDDEAIGYWGQRIVLKAQQLGLNTCWVAMCSRKKSKAVCNNGKKVRLVIAVGYGKTPGNERKTKPASELSTAEGPAPEWFATAVEAAQLAPTAMNNQHFHITLRADGRTVSIKAPSGSLDVIDLGIVKRNFEEAANALGADWCWE